jgi:hypothetical protein
VPADEQMEFHKSLRRKLSAKKASNYLQVLASTGKEAAKYIPK